MATLIYAPEVTVRIRTDANSRGKGKIIDVSEDIVRGSVTRVNKGVSKTTLTLTNQGRKYDGMFSPMDTVVVYMRRIKTVLKFAGYLDSTPKWTAVGESIDLTASCSLKRLQQFYWDPGAPASVSLLNPDLSGPDGDVGFSRMQDGGLAKRTIEVLTKVAGWPEAQIHIGRIPENWYDKVSKIADELIAESEAAQMAETVGSGSWIGGSNPISGGVSVKGIGPGTGTLPATSGRISYFGGPGGGAYGNMGLTGESGVRPRDPWYCAMRWPYTDANAVKGAKDWWVNRKILVVNPKNNKAVVLRAADWGPHVSTGRVIDVGPQGIKAIGASTDDVVHIAFAPPNANLGPVKSSSANLGNTIGQSAGTSAGMSAPIRSGWGAPGDESNIVRAQAGGKTFYVHRMAKARFEGFVNDLVRIYGYRPQSIGGYNDRNIKGTGTKSNHAWGAAIDIDPTRNPYVSSGTRPYALPKPPGIVNLARKWGLGWGGEWNNSKDYMHFEVIGGPSSSTYGGVSGGGAEPVVVTKWKPPLHGNYTVSARFGEKGPSWENGHSGTDFAAPSGTPIHPVGPGKVHDKGFDAGAYGNWVSIDHGGKNYTFYAHMQAPATVSVGTSVSTSTSIGRVGTTGNVTGAHVHVEYRKGEDSYAAALRSGGIEKYVLGGAPPPAGAQGVEGDYSTYQPADETSGMLTGEGLLNVFQYNLAEMSEGGVLLSGPRALLNDQPLLPTIEELMGAGLRDYCSAPNGDFIAWFPDYFGHYRQAGKMVISPLEIDGVRGAPKIKWSDENLKTHQFVSSASFTLAGDANTVFRQATTAGVASIEYPELMEALLNISRKDAEALRDHYLPRYGARPSYKAMNVITGARQEFFFACHLFMQNWSQQYRTSISLMFMPELYPGMLACFPDFGVQGYVEETTDSFDLTGNGSFTTTVSCAPWSSIGRAKTEQARGLPVGAPL